jgi:hypothetical protein
LETMVEIRTSLPTDSPFGMSTQPWTRVEVILRSRIPIGEVPLLTSW